MELRQHNFALLLVAAMFFWSGLACATVQVNALRYSTTSAYTRIVFETSVPVEDHQLVMMRNPDRLVIDVANGVLNGALPQAPANHPSVRGVRSGMRDSSHLRLVVDLKHAIQAKSSVVSEGRGGHQLVIDLYSGGGTPPAPSPARQEAPPVQVDSTAKAVSEPPAPMGNRVSVKQAAVPAAQQPAPKRAAKQELREVVVAIDAGHGGDDPGAHGSLGTEEKQVALAIARKLEAMIKQQSGMKPVMIRNGDYYIGLRQRIQKARKYKADLFVSIHADAYVNDDAQGSSVFTLSEKGATSEAAKWLAERENAADLVGGVKLNDKDNVLASVLLDLSQTATQEASQEIAQTLLRELSRANNLHHQQVQRAGFAVLKSPDIPSVLVETAFISNPEEERKLKDPVHQDHIARSIFQGIRNYFAMRAPPGTQLAAQ